MSENKGFSLFADTRHPRGRGDPILFQMREILIFRHSSSLHPFVIPAQAGTRNVKEIYQDISRFLLAQE